MTWEEIEAQYRKEHPLLAEAVDIAIKMVTDMDMAEVVRCRDCKYNTLGGGKGNSLCELEMPLFQNDDFCSRGERK